MSRRISDPLATTKNEPMTLTAILLSRLSAPVLLEPLALPRRSLRILTMQDVIGRGAKPNRRPYATRASVEHDGTNAMSATAMSSFSIPPLGLGNRPMYQTPLPLWCALVNSSSVPPLKVAHILSMACAIAFSLLLRCAAHVVGYQNLESPTIQRSEADRQRALRIFAYEPCLGQCRIKLSAAAFQAIAPRSDPMKKLDAETSPPWRFSRLAHAARGSLVPRRLDELFSSMSAYVASSLQLHCAYPNPASLLMVGLSSWIPTTACDGFTASK
jgi:hypothetical protein